MRKLKFYICLCLLAAAAAGNSGKDGKKILFVYDKIDESSKFYVENFRGQFKENEIEFEEFAVDSSNGVDLSEYGKILVFSRVMAFNMASTVRKWVHSKLDLKDKELFIFVTAGKWFYKGHRKDLVKHAEKNGGTVVDAVSMATEKLSEEEKRARITECVLKLKQ